MRTLLMRYNRELHDAQLSRVIARLSWLADRALRTTRLNALMGVEGGASVAYFSVLKRLFKRQWPFQGRVRRPPTDPVNVLLSFGYTLLTRDLEASIAGNCGSAWSSSLIPRRTTCACTGSAPFAVRRCWCLGAARRRRLPDR